jgi:hypothetical protein
MTKAADTAPVGTNEAAEVVTISREEYDALLAAKDGGVNPEPAFEEGPHLDDPEHRALKRQAMRDAGLTHDDDRLTSDMRKILREKG